MRFRRNPKKKHQKNKKGALPQIGHDNSILILIKVTQHQEI